MAIKRVTITINPAGGWLVSARFPDSTIPVVWSCQSWQAIIQSLTAAAPLLWPPQDMHPRRRGSMISPEWPYLRASARGDAGGE